MAGTNPESSSITEVTLRCPDQTAKPSPVRVGERKLCGKKELAGFIEGLGASGVSRHGDFSLLQSMDAEEQTLRQ